MEGTLNLDARQRAMLDEMGIKLWWPAAPTAAAHVDAPAVAAPSPHIAPAPAAAAPVAIRTASPAPVTAPPLAARPLAAPSGASVLIDAPRLLYGSEAAAGRGWLIVADMPPELDGRHGEPFAGEAGRLFEAMLRALQLQAGAVPVHLMRTHRGVAAGQPGSPRPMAEAFEEQAAALAPSLVLAMGPLAAQGLMQSADPLGKLRGRAVPLASIQGVSVVATYHPAYLLRNPADKARAWADLCLAAEQQTAPN